MIIAFITYPAFDLDRAVEFYQKVLGIKPLFHRKDWAEFKIEGQRFALQKVKSSKMEHTGAILYFMAQPIVDNIERLQDIGAKSLGSIEIHSYGKLARFQDPAGNILDCMNLPSNDGFIWIIP